MLASWFAYQDHILTPTQMADWGAEEPTQPTGTCDQPNPGGMIHIHYNNAPFVLAVIPSATSLAALMLLPTSGRDDRRSPDAFPISRLVIRNMPLDKYCLEALLTLAGQRLSGVAQSVDIHLSPTAGVEQSRALAVANNMPSQSGQLFAQAHCVTILPASAAAEWSRTVRNPGARVRTH